MQRLFNQPKKIATGFDPQADISLYQGDVEHLLTRITSRFIKLIITSPPYNVGKSYEDKVSIEDYLDKQRVIIEKLRQILCDDGSICWQVGNFIYKGEVFPLDIFYPKGKNPSDLWEIVAQD